MSFPCHFRTRLSIACGAPTSRSIWTEPEFDQAIAVGRPIVFAFIDAILVGLGVGLFEEFYVQTLRGRWLRRMHPLASIGVYTSVVVVMFLVAIHLSHLMLGRLDDLPLAYDRLPFALPLFVAFSVIGVIVMRVVHFIGVETMFHLTLGTYHRPVPQAKVLLDINGSTAWPRASAPSG